MSVWKPEYFRLFLSHVSKDKEDASTIKDALGFFGIDCFVAHCDIKPTKKWLREIEDALRTMDAFAALLTKGFRKSVWTDQEIGFALARDVLIIPIQYPEVPHGFINPTQGYKPYDGQSFKSIAEDIVGVLSNDIKTSERMAHALIERLQISNSFDDSKGNVRLLERCVQIKQSDVEKLSKITISNRQVRDAFGVSEKVSSIVNKFSV